ncbi:RING finger protein unkempt homolog [Styela clava]
MSTAQPQTEKPYHYTYLKEFRVNQCPLFLQHKCTQHRPFTCFNWHFANQRRRRPMRKRDGTFNYSSDVYCSKYDETSGICPNGDECHYLHRNTGDTERRYHLRYYKTGTCIHETDSRGNCVKNGPHCAFAHGAPDLRPPVYDVREMEKPDPAQRAEPIEQCNLSEKIINDDPKWQDGNYVLANYKTEPCRRPPRLCRQGYACPQFHNPKDRRRNPKKYKYRSSPCPNVKQGDDWKDPSSCDKGDNCQFCHTRTEQQFHPEIYKSTKCHDMLQNGYCPRGPFCAFAHVHTEIRVLEDVDLNNLPPGVQVLSPNSLSPQSSGPQDGGIAPSEPKAVPSNAPGAGRPQAPNDLRFSASFESTKNVWNSDSPTIGGIPAPFSLPDRHQQQSLFQSPQSPLDSVSNNTFPSCPSPIAKPNWLSSSLGKGEGYLKAPGSGRGEFQAQSLGGLASSPFSWGGGSMSSHLIGRNSLSSTESSPKSLNRLRLLNCEAKPFYPPDETVDSVIGNALDDFEGHDLLDNKSGPSSASKLWPDPIGSGRNDNSSFFTMSAPVNIPQEMRMSQRNPLPTPSPPSGANQTSFYGSLDAVGGRGSYAGSLPSIGRPPSSSGFSSKEGFSGSVSGNDSALMELDRMQRKCKQWEESWNQAKTACDAWKKEATEANERARIAQESAKKNLENAQSYEHELQKANDEIAILAEDVQNRENSKNIQKCMFLHRAQKTTMLKQSSVKDLKELRTKLKSDLDSVDKVLWESYGIHCEEGWVKK